MKTLYFAYICSEYECEGMFDAGGNLLGMWDCNDAQWRNEYFKPMMLALGFEIKNADDNLLAKFEKMVVEFYEDDGE